LALPIYDLLHFREGFRQILKNFRLAAFDA